MSTSFWQLLCSRFALGLGSSGLTLLSMITINGTWPGNIAKKHRKVISLHSELIRIHRNCWRKAACTVGKFRDLYRDGHKYGRRTSRRLDIQALFLALVSLKRPEIGASDLNETNAHKCFLPRVCSHRVRDRRGALFFCCNQHKAGIRAIISVSIRRASNGANRLRRMDPSCTGGNDSTHCCHARRQLPSLGASSRDSAPDFGPAIHLPLRVIRVEGRCDRHNRHATYF